MLVHLQEVTPFQKAWFNIIDFIANISAIWLVCFALAFAVIFAYLTLHFHERVLLWSVPIAFITIMFAVICFQVKSLHAIEVQTSLNSIERVSDVKRNELRNHTETTLPKSFATPQRLKSPFVLYCEEKDGKNVFLNQFPTEVSASDKMALQLNHIKAQEVSFDSSKDEALSKFFDTMASSGFSEVFDILAVKSSSNHTTIKYAVLED